MCLYVLLSRKPFSKKLLNQKSLLALFGIIIIMYAVCCFSTSNTVHRADEPVWARNLFFYFFFSSSTYCMRYERTHKMINKIYLAVFEL